MRPKLTILPATLILILAQACSDDDGGGGDAGPADDTGPRGDRGSGDQRAADQGPGGDTRATGLGCPAVPPADEAACSSAMRCYYPRCEDEGNVVTATCAGAAWSVSTDTFACEGLVCPGGSCGETQLCLDRSQGAEMGDCVDNPCGTGPLTCACLEEICGHLECTIIGPRTFRCDEACEGCP
jgi:hypothetical protein